MKNILSKEQKLAGERTQQDGTSKLGKALVWAAQAMHGNDPESSAVIRELERALAKRSNSQQ